MKIVCPPLTKILFIIFGCVIAAVTVVILMISPITKYLIEKYDEQVLGRQILVDWVYVNPFTGYVHISNLRIYESKDQGNLVNPDTVFFTARGASANFSLFKLFSRTIEIEELTVDRPRGMIIQDRRILNFSDLIKRFTPAKPASGRPGFHFNILRISISEGEFHYIEKQTPIRCFVTGFNLESTGKRWNDDTIGARISFRQGSGTGDVHGDFNIDFKTEKYRYAVVVNDLDMNVIEQYLKDMTNNGCFSATLDADLRSRGNFRDEEDLFVTGKLAINHFHFGKNLHDDLASFDRLSLDILQFSPVNHQYLFDSVSLVRPFFKYERYEKLDNLQAMFGKNGANIKAAADDPSRFNLVIEIARYIKVLSRNFFRSDYKINRMAVYNGNLQFNDYAVTEKFSASLQPMEIIADSIDKTHSWVNVSLHTGIKPYGKASLTVSINPRDSTDFNLTYKLEQLPAAMFNPYLITYTSFPLDRGTLEATGAWKVRSGIIQSDNHLVIIDPRVTARRKNKGTTWIPLTLIMSFIREKGNVIDYDIPITGDLKSPKFHLHDVLVDLLTNIFVKPAATAYRMEVKTIETEIEKSMTVKWQMRQSTLRPKQDKFLKKIAGFLVKNPGASLSVNPQNYAVKEKEYILFFEAKKKYFLATRRPYARTFNEEDSERVDKMSVADSLFVHYLERQVNDPAMFTRQEQCAKFIGAALVNSGFRRLSKEREAAFLTYFKIRHVEKQVTMNMESNVVPYNGFSFYKINYRGKMPNSLKRAYRNMDELNSEPPREKFGKERKKNKVVL